jgi:hypothetical protein
MCPVCNGPGVVLGLWGSLRDAETVAGTFKCNRTPTPKACRIRKRVRPGSRVSRVQSRP